MVYKVVFHVNLPDEAAFDRGLGNATNLLKSITGQEHEVVMLLNGASVHLLTGDAYLSFQDKVKGLHEQGVHFRTCNNSLQKFELDPANLAPEWQVVPAGITALVELQSAGYAYVKP